MTDSLLKYKPTKKRLETRAENIDNGNDAEVLAASFLIMAIGAEISWGSRNEDGRKIDLICSYDHPWFEKERFIFFVQVKSGDSYGEKLTDGFRLKTIAKNAAKRTTHPVCVIWIDRDSGNSYWAYVHPKSESKPQNYGNNHLVTPTMRYDIARCQAHFLPIKKGGAGIILSEKNTDLATIRKKALTKYKSYQLSGLLIPNLGKIEVTRVGWRHMFRKTRALKNKAKSLTTIRFLDKIVCDIPSETYISSCEFTEQAEYNYRTSEYVLTYENVKIQNTTLEKVKVVVRVIEVVRWPKDWNKNSTLKQFVERRNILLSCYYK